MDQKLRLPEFHRHSDPRHKSFSMNGTLNIQIVEIIFTLSSSTSGHVLQVVCVCVLQCAAVCCGVLQCAAVCCGVMQCAVVLYS